MDVEVRGMEMKIVIDNRESKKRIAKAQSVFDSALIENDVSTIEVGDYLLYNNNNEVVAAIEYKTYNDFVSSMINGHLESQIQDMEEYTHPYLFVVGTYGQWRKRSPINVSKKSIEGFMVKVLCTYKTRLIQFDSETEALDAMIMLLNRSRKDKGDIRLPERHKTTGNPVLDMYLAVPGIGPSKADEYSKHLSFISFINVCKLADAKNIFKRAYGITVTESVIEYCKTL